MRIMGSFLPEAALESCKGLAMTTGIREDTDKRTREDTGKRIREDTGKITVMDMEVRAIVILS